jgi:prefoldin subunit 5
MQVNDARFRFSVVERKEKVEAVLVKLQSLKSQISELRVQCEALKKLQSEKQKDLTCSECGK